MASKITAVPKYPFEKVKTPKVDTGSTTKFRCGGKKMAKGGTAKSCWPGYEKKGTKKMYGKTYNNCVKK
jgi:hypothetical protein